VTEPSLETDRLVVRRFRSADGEALWSYLSLSETYRFEPGAPISRVEADHLASQRASSPDFWAVAHKDGTLVGHLYFHLTDPAEFLTWELGYIFHPDHQGKGYCTEASRALVAHAFDHWNAHRVVAFCDPLNPASWKVLEKCGLEREGLFRQKAFFRRDKNGAPLWHDCLAYGKTR